MACTLLSHQKCLTVSRRIREVLLHRKMTGWKEESCFLPCRKRTQDIFKPTRNREWKIIAARVRAKSQSQTATVFFNVQNLLSSAADRPGTELTGQPHGKFEYIGKVYLISVHSKSSAALEPLTSHWAMPSSLHHSFVKCLGNPHWEEDFSQCTQNLQLQKVFPLNLLGTIQQPQFIE